MAENSCFELIFNMRDYSTSFFCMKNMLQQKWQNRAEFKVVCVYHEMDYDCMTFKMI